MEGDFNSEEFAGIVPRSVNTILDYLEGSDADYSVRVSFLELCKLFVSKPYYQLRLPVQWDYETCISVCSSNYLDASSLACITDNEELLDLLATGPEKKLKLYEDIKKGVVCQNLLEILVTSASDIFEILQKGDSVCQSYFSWLNYFIDASTALSWIFFLLFLLQP